MSSRPSSRPAIPVSRSRAAARRAARQRAVRRRRLVAVATLVLVLIIVAVALASSGGSGHRSASTGANAGAGRLGAGHSGHGASGPLNIYSHDGPGDLSPVDRNDPALVYVPNTISSTVDVISQRTFKVVDQFATGNEPQHVTPSWDLKTLYVDNDLGNTLTPINPRTGQPGNQIPVVDPYNLYFSPDGHYAIVVSERLQTLYFRNPHTMAIEHELHIPQCAGLDHADFSPDGRYMYASCEFAGRMVEIDLNTLRVVSTLVLHDGRASPQDVKLSPDGRTLYSADQLAGGLWEIDPATFRVTGFLRTGLGAHGLYPSRNAQDMYVSNRAEGTVSVVSFATRRVIAKWTLPQPASPDMGGVSLDGKTLWLSGRYNSVVYAIDTANGHLRAAIPVGDGPHGLCVWPQPGRYSLGHTGIMR